MIEIDANGQRVLLDDGEVEWLIARASAASGSSSPCRDLALLLESRVSSHRPIALRRAEARTLAALLGERSAA